MKRKTHEEYVNEVSNSVTILGEYINCRTKINVKCNKCNHIWLVNPRNLLNKGHGCPECGRKKSADTKNWNISQECFINKIPKCLLDEISLLGKYVDQRSEIKVKCKKCGRIWVSQPCRLYKGHGCIECAKKELGIRNRKTQKQFEHDVALVHGNRIKVLGQYETSKKRIDVECNNCGYYWNPVAKRLLNRGCPVCKSSKAEYFISRLLDKNSVKYQREFVFPDLLGPGGGFLRFDFAIFHDHLSHLIEYDGVHHFLPQPKLGGKSYLNLIKQRDRIKTLYCQKNNIRLIRIPYTIKLKDIKIEDLL